MSFLVSIKGVLLEAGHVVRPIVSKVGLFDRWPLILIDLHTEEGIVGRSYLEPYLERSVRYLIPTIRDLAEVRKGQQIVPFDDFHPNPEPDEAQLGVDRFTVR